MKWIVFRSSLGIVCRYAVLSTSSVIEDAMQFAVNASRKSLITLRFRESLALDSKVGFEENEIIELTPFSSLVWRIIFSDQAEQACKPVRSPIGRFHHSEQIALYTSCTEEGAGIAIKRYLKPDDAERIIVPLYVSADCVYDIRKTGFSSRASTVWQDSVAKGEPAPTWVYSDAARKSGAQGMLYASRSRPDLTHLVLFDVPTGIVQQSGGGRAWYTS